MPSLLLSVLMAAITLLGSVFDTTSGTHTVTATPAVNDLIVIVTVGTGSVATTACTDNNSSGTYDVVKTCVKASSADTMTIQIRKALITSASSTIFTCAPGTTTGGGIAVYKVTGITRLGSNAARQSASQSNQATSTTPTPVFGLAALTGNPVIGAVFNASNVATMTPRSSPAYTEDLDTGWNSPTSGVETMHVNSGETGTSIAWGGTSGSAFCSAVVEIDTSTLVVTSPSPGKQSLVLTPQPPTIPTVFTTIRVNAGGPAYVDSGGFNWQDNNGTFGTDTFNVANAIDNTIEDTLYQSERFGNPFTLTYNVPNGSYSVTLKFAEIFHSAPNLREFNVAINGVTVLTNYDIWSACGGFEFRAIDTTFGTVVTGGSIALVFTGVIDNAQINALLITPSTVTSVTPATATLTLTRNAPLIRLGVVPAKATLALTAKTPTVTVTTSSITCSPGKATLTLTGVAPAIRIGVSPGKASLALTTKLPVVQYGVVPAKAILSIAVQTPVLRRGVVPTNASLAITAQTPVLRRGVIPSQASLALVAKTPTMLAGVTPAKAALTVTPKLPTVGLGVNPAKAALTITGRTPSLILRVFPGVQALTTVPKTPTVRIGVIPSLATSLHITGKTPSLSLAVAIPKATLTLTSNPPAIRTSVIPATATVTITGKTPSLLLKVMPGTASITLTPKTPTERVGVIPGTATLSITPRTPTIRRGVSPAVASLVIAQKTPTVIVGGTQTVNPGKAALSFTALAPTVRVSIFPATSTLTLTPRTPIIRRSVLPARGTLSLTPIAPTVSITGTFSVFPASRPLTITGLAPSLHTSIRLPAPPALTVTGIIPTVYRNVSITPASAHIALVSRPPVIVITPVTPTTAAVIAIPVSGIYNTTQLCDGVVNPVAALDGIYNTVFPIAIVIKGVQ